MTIKAPTLNVAGLGADPLAQRISEKQTKWKYKIAVLSGKGGVGKSTVAVNLAAALAKKATSSVCSTRHTRPPQRGEDAGRR